MTGHGQATVRDEQVQVLVEIRTVNNRFLKININGGDLDAAQTAAVEAAVKLKIERGSVNVRVQKQALDGERKFRIDAVAVKSYASQLKELTGEDVDVTTLLSLPGAITEATLETGSADPHAKTVLETVNEALSKLTAMRNREGEAMSDDLTQNCALIEGRLEQIEQLAPRVIDNYAKKMTDRINKMLEQLGSSVTPAELIKEVGVFAERVDISEETVRLASHIKQFREIIADKKSNGRKLDFLTQEMLRETNTIGSKANDAEIAAHVVEIKTVIERIREMVQNVE